MNVSQWNGLGMMSFCAVHYGHSQKGSAVMKVEGRSSRPLLSKTKRLFSFLVECKFCHFPLQKWKEICFKVSHRVKWHFKIILFFLHATSFYYCFILLKLRGGCCYLGYHGIPTVSQVTIAATFSQWDCSTGSVDCIYCFGSLDIWCTSWNLNLGVLTWKWMPPTGQDPDV